MNSVGSGFHIQLQLKLGTGRKLDILSINNEPGTILGFKNMEPKFEFETGCKVTLKIGQ